MDGIDIITSSVLKKRRNPDRSKKHLNPDKKSKTVIFSPTPPVAATVTHGPVPASVTFSNGIIKVTNPEGGGIELGAVTQGFTHPPTSPNKKGTVVFVIDRSGSMNSPNKSADIPIDTATPFIHKMMGKQARLPRNLHPKADLYEYAYTSRRCLANCSVRNAINGVKTSELVDKYNIRVVEYNYHGVEECKSDDFEVVEAWTNVDGSCNTIPGRFFKMLAKLESTLLKEDNIFVFWTDDKSNSNKEPIQTWVRNDKGVYVLISIMVILMSSSSNILTNMSSYKPKTDEEKAQLAAAIQRNNKYKRRDGSNGFSHGTQTSGVLATLGYNPDGNPAFGPFIGDALGATHNSWDPYKAADNVIEFIRLNSQKRWTQVKNPYPNHIVLRFGKNALNLPPCSTCQVCIPILCDFQFVVGNTEEQQAILQVFPSKTGDS